MTEVIKLHTVRFIVRSPRMGDALGILICSNEGQRHHMVIDFTPMTTSVKRKAKFGATYPMEITFQKVRTIHGEKQKH